MPTSSAPRVQASRGVERALAFVGLAAGVGAVISTAAASASGVLPTIYAPLLAALLLVCRARPLVGASPVFDDVVSRLGETVGRSALLKKWEAKLGSGGLVVAAWAALQMVAECVGWVVGGGSASMAFVVSALAADIAAATLAIVAACHFTIPSIDFECAHSFLFCLLLLLFSWGIDWRMLTSRNAVNSSRLRSSCRRHSPRRRPSWPASRSASSRPRTKVRRSPTLSPLARSLTMADRPTCDAYSSAAHARPAGDEAGRRAEGLCRGRTELRPEPARHLQRCREAPPRGQSAGTHHNFVFLYFLLLVNIQLFISYYNYLVIWLFISFGRACVDTG